MFARQESKYWGVSFLLVSLLFVTGTAFNQQLSLPFEEVAQSSDLIFIGTVERQISRLNDQNTMIFTDVFFKEIVIIHASARSVQIKLPEIKLTYAGGIVGEQRVTINGAPAFKNENRYLVFMFDDGKTYSSPIVGGSQGLFEVVKDVNTAEEFVLAAGRKVIVGVSTSGIEMGKTNVAYIQNGVPVGEERNNAIPDRFYSQKPIPVNPTDAVSLSEQTATGNSEHVTPLRLDEFLDYIRNVALKLPLERKMLKQDSHGSFFWKNGAMMEVEEIESSVPPIRMINEEADYEQNTNTARIVPLGDIISPGAVSDESRVAPLAGGALGACGYHSLFLTMQQVPTDWWSFPIDNDCMWTWNQFMDIYRYIDSDGTYGNNSQNEFCGWVDDTNLNSVYGFSWGGGLAMCITWMTGTCGVIGQSDILWNAAYSWTSDAEYAIGNSGVLLLRPIAMHELGHSWGEQLGTYTETYDYDVLTVMHSYYSSIVESGWGIHWADAYLIRRHYDDQTSILSTVDMGVESYYASNGLINSSTNASTFLPGQSITLNNVSVENMSNSAVSNARIRFYLSTNRVISTADYLMGSYFYWASFPGEAYSVYTYSTSIPSGIPAGTYYIGAIVTINGDDSDSYTSNSSTSFRYSITVQQPVPTPPTLASPLNGAIDRPTSLTLDWNASAGATSYRLQVDNNSDFSSPFYNQAGLTATEQAVSGLANGTTYYWRVNASNASGTSAYSSIWSFATLPAIPSPPILASPANGAINQPTSLTLDWNASTGATSYRLQVDNNSDFSSPYYNQAGLTATEQAVSGLANGTTYHWRVNATNSGGTSAYSSVWSFTTATGITPPPPPILVSPLSGATNQPTTLTLDWDASTGATSYRLQVDDNSDFSSQFYDQAGLTATQQLISGLTNSTTYYWRANATNAAGPSSWSSVWQLTTTATPSSPWPVVITSKNATIAVPVAINPTLDGQALKNGDAIGAFFLRDGAPVCGGYCIWQTGQSGAITAYGDDEISPLKDGFSEGELINYRIWDSASGTDWSANATYQMGGPNYSTNGIMVLASLAGSKNVTQNIALPSGWSMISSYVSPQDPLLTTMMAAIASQMTLMKNGAGQVYWPAYGINTIGSWNYRHGYQIYMQSPLTLAVAGSQLQPESVTLPLAQGWNMAAYLRTSAMPIQTALSSIISNMILVKNGAGQVYWPAYGINTIGSMQPGQGYQMYLTQATDLTYPANALAKEQAADGAWLPACVHFGGSVRATGSSAAFVWRDLPFADGDEIAVFAGGDQLVGSRSSP